MSYRPWEMGRPGDGARKMQNPSCAPMNTHSMRRLVGVFMESPTYTTLSRKERRELITRFLELYSGLPDTTSSKDTDEAASRKDPITN